MRNMDKQLSPIERRLKNLIKEVEESDLYTPQNKKLVLEFVNTCKAKNLTAHRICFYLDRLKQIAKTHRKDFKKWDRKDVEIVMAKLGDKGYSAWTMECFKTTFKVFYRWICGLERTDPAPKLVRWLSKENVPTNIRKEDLLTRKDIQDMLNATNKPMYKALIAVLNAGARPGEALGMRIRDIKEVNGLIKIYVNGKMEKKMGERPLYIVEYTDEFRSWVRRHLERDKTDSKLFVGKNGELKYGTLTKAIKRLAERAGIKKKINCYRFRHTAGTRYYGKYEGSYARRLMGHAAGSKMEAVYCHLNEEDIEARLLGKKMPEENEPDIPTIEKETQELIDLGKAIKKLAEMHPEVIDVEKLQAILSK